MGPAAGPDVPPERSRWLGSFLARGRNLILVVALLLLILTVIFSGTTASFFEGIGAVYRSIEGIRR